MTSKFRRFLKIFYDFPSLTKWENGWEWVDNVQRKKWKMSIRYSVLMVMFYVFTLIQCGQH